VRRSAKIGGSASIRLYGLGVHFHFLDSADPSEIRGAIQERLDLDELSQAATVSSPGRGPYPDAGTSHVHGDHVASPDEERLADRAAV